MGWGGVEGEGGRGNPGSRKPFLLLPSVPILLTRNHHTFMTSLHVCKNFPFIACMYIIYIAVCVYVCAWCGGRTLTNGIVKLSPHASVCIALSVV